MHIYLAFASTSQNQIARLKSHYICFNMIKTLATPHVLSIQIGHRMPMKNAESQSAFIPSSARLQGRVPRNYVYIETCSAQRL